MGDNGLWRTYVLSGTPHPLVWIGHFIKGRQKNSECPPLHMILVFNITRHPKHQLKKFSFGGMFTRRFSAFLCDNIGQVESCFWSKPKKHQREYKYRIRSKLQSTAVFWDSFKGRCLHRDTKKQQWGNKTLSSIHAFPYLINIHNKGNLSIDHMREWGCLLKPIRNS